MFDDRSSTNYEQYEQEQALIKPPRRKVYKRKKKIKKHETEELETEDDYDDGDDDFNNEETLLNPPVDYFQETDLNENSPAYPDPTTGTSVGTSTYPIGDDFFRDQDNTATENFTYMSQPNLQQEQAILNRPYQQQQQQPQPHQPQLQQQREQFHQLPQHQPQQIYTPQEQAYDLNDMSDVQMQLNQQGQGVGIVLRSSPRYSRTGQGNNQG